MRRRQFLTGSLACGLLASRTSLAGNAGQNGRLVVGQIGTSHAHAAGQVATVRRLSDQFELRGVVEEDPQKRKAAEQRPEYNDVDWLTADQLLSDESVDIIAVETDVADLLTTARRCTDAGKHIHLDKPAGESLRELKQLHDSAKTNRCLIQMGYMYRYNPAFTFLYRVAKEGWLGEIFEVHAVMSKTVDRETRRELARYPGGSMFELGCHLVDPLLTLLGPPSDVTPFNRATQTYPDGLLDNMLAVFEFEKATATIRSSLVEVEGFRRRQFVVCGTQGTIAIRPLEPPKLELTLREPKGDFARGAHQVELRKAPGRYDGAWNDLATCIRESRPLPWNTDHDYEVQKCLLQACGLPLE